jgi:low affinity Fe/Cu permease
MWQLVINTTPTIITFLMVFLIQNAQSPGRSCDPAEAGRAHSGRPGRADRMVRLEELSDEDLCVRTGATAT